MGAMFVRWRVREAARVADGVYRLSLDGVFETSAKGHYRNSSLKSSSYSDTLPQRKHHEIGRCSATPWPSKPVTARVPCAHIACGAATHGPTQPCHGAPVTWETGMIPLRTAMQSLGAASPKRDRTHRFGCLWASAPTKAIGHRPMRPNTSESHLRQRRMRWSGMSARSCTTARSQSVSCARVRRPPRERRHRHAG